MSDIARTEGDLIADLRVAMLNECVGHIEEGKKKDARIAELEKEINQ